MFLIFRSGWSKLDSIESPEWFRFLLCPLHWNMLAMLQPCQETQPKMVEDLKAKTRSTKSHASRAHWLKQNLTLILNRLQPCSSFSHLDVEKETIDCSQSSKYHQFSFVDSKNELTKNWSNTSFFSALFWSIPKLIRCVSKPSVVWHVSRSRHAEFTKTCKQHVHLGRLVWSESPGRFTRSFLHTHGKMQYEMHSYIYI